MTKFFIPNFIRTALIPMAGVILVACGQKDKPKDFNPSSPTIDTPTEAIVEEPVLTMAKFSERIRSSGAVLTFTDCPMDDGAVWSGSEDPLGVLVCGANYDVRFRSETNEWVVTGVKEREGVAADNLPRMEHAYSGKDPSEGLMVVWGGTYRFDETGKVFSARRGSDAIGRLTLNE